MNSQGDSSADGHSGGPYDGHGGHPMPHYAQHSHEQQHYQQHPHEQQHHPQHPHEQQQYQQHPHEQQQNTRNIPPPPHSIHRLPSIPSVHSQHAPPPPPPTQQQQQQYVPSHGNTGSAPSGDYGQPPPATLHSQLPSMPYAPQSHGGPLPHQGQQLMQIHQPQQPNAHPLADLIKVFQGRKYKLVVVQQPKRARMCGFGDKDRRPITPPPCVRLIVTNEEDGKPTNDNDIPYLCFVCHVSLWSEDGTNELDIVRHSSGNPSISSTTTASYASIQESSAPPYNSMAPNSRQNSYIPPGAPYGNVSSYPVNYGQQSASAPAPAPYMNNGYSPANTYYPNNDYRGSMVPNAVGGNGMSYGSNYAAQSQDQPPVVTRSSGPHGMFTRNLVGQSVVSAQRLTDTDDKVGVWFILHDLSVRTEGNFRLKFTVVNIAADNNSSNVSINQGSVPILASCFSDAFTVYSAKKFPGVCESTALSKCFASQGIKIPIRKEGGADKNNNDEDYE
ncbi:hypothetical protein BROUX41_004969 [Berkeleyomyces rouxiae]|uniref:uncharacterized protein n=1 Tax=Berkeleyomyces rouxiae TaxID=2035830 RepID=UPI003B75D53A